MSGDPFMECWLFNGFLSFVRDNADFLKILVAAIGGAFALYKWRKDNAAKRSMKFRELIDNFQSDKNVKQLIYILDDDEKIWFLEEFVGDPNVAPVLDKLLFRICYVIYLYKKQKFIAKDEFLTLSYMIDRPLQNPQLQDYLYNLKMYAEYKGIQHPYKYLVDYGLEQGYLDDRFKASKQDKVDCKKIKYHEYYKNWLKKEKEFLENQYESLD